MTYDTSTYRSPNYDWRPRGTVFDSCVLHSTEGDWPSDIEWLCNPDSKVSTHFVISPIGAIYQLVSPELRAWHAGVSQYAGRSFWNNFSIGVELSHRQGHPYPPQQIESAGRLMRDLVARFPIKHELIVAHRWIAPKRKSDPTDWSDHDLHDWIDAGFADSRPDGTAIPAPPATDHLQHYVVRANVTLGATIRAAPRVNGAVLGRLRAGDAWIGEPIEAATFTFVKGFGSSKTWIRSAAMMYVWSGLLEKVTP
jgi:hypothetical protein